MGMRSFPGLLVVRWAVCRCVYVVADGWYECLLGCFWFGDDMFSLRCAGNLKVGGEEQHRLYFSVIHQAC